MSHKVLIDSFSRVHNYLRMSLTEKCNFRCQYCMPIEGVKLSCRSDLLSLNERKTVLSLFNEMGVTKYRFTGGEPTLSKDLNELISFVRQLPVYNASRNVNLSDEPMKIADSANHVQTVTDQSINFKKRMYNNHTIGITTNGYLLKESYIQNLIDSGLDSINISLDSLSASKFASLTRRSENTINHVLSAISSCHEMGLKVKINCVLMKGINDSEIYTFIESFIKTSAMKTQLNPSHSPSENHPVDIRFIELMPFDGNNWTQDKYISYKDVINTLHGQGFHLQKINDKDGVSHGANNTQRISNLYDKNDTTKWYYLEGYEHCGRIGFITSMSEHFCGKFLHSFVLFCMNDIMLLVIIGSCNRLRITADGRLKVCLFGDESLSLRDALRSSLTTDADTDGGKLDIDMDSDKYMNVRTMIEKAVYGKKAKLGGFNTIEDLASKSKDNRPMILIGG